MKKLVYTTFQSITLVLLLGFSLSSFIKNKPVKNKMPASNGMVVLELFTSQGCSSCPPADAVLAKYVLENNPRIVPLAFHVDYWNRLGWKDPFSQVKFTERQNFYSQTFHSENIYTPQLVINGKHELVGSKVSSIDKTIKDELALNVAEEIKLDSIKYIGNRIKINVNSLNTTQTSYINIALVKKKEVTNIKSGENNSLKLVNYNIVFDFIRLTSDDVKSKSVFIPFNKSVNPEDYLLVVYLQNSITGKILGATKQDLPKRKSCNNY